MSECDCSDQAVSVVVVVFVVVVVGGVNFFSFFDFFYQTSAQICFKFCVDVPSVDPYSVYQNRCATPIFMELWVILCNFWPIIKKSSIKPLTRNHSYLVWRVPKGSSF